MEIKVETLRTLVEEADFEGKKEWGEKLGITEDRLNEIINSGKVSSQEELFDLCSFFWSYSNRPRSERKTANRL
ncbi:hypothetical protein AAHB40_04475 [Bacillus velezensis]